MSASLLAQWSEEYHASFKAVMPKLPVNVAETNRSAHYWHKSNRVPGRLTRFAKGFGPPPGVANNADTIDLSQSTDTRLSDNL